MTDFLLRLVSLSVGGAAAIALLLAIEHLAGLRYAAKWRCLAWLLLCLRCAPRLLTCQGLQTPMLAGLFRPRLLLPADTMDLPRLRHALLHELTHYKRRDILYKALVLWVCALHWFNPAVWLMRRAVERDLELACDDAALRMLPECEHAAYGNTVLMAATKQRGAQT